MKRLLIITILTLVFAIAGRAQDVCPADKVCLDHETANKALTAITALVEAKTTIAKLMNERAASDALIASANTVIADFKALDEIHTMQISKYKDIVALYEKVITLYSGLVEKMQAQINKPKSGFSRFVGVLEKVVIILAGVSIGRGL